MAILAILARPEVSKTNLYVLSNIAGLKAYCAKTSRRQSNAQEHLDKLQNLQTVDAQSISCL